MRGPAASSFSQPVVFGDPNGVRYFGSDLPMLPSSGLSRTVEVGP